MIDPPQGLPDVKLAIDDRSYLEPGKLVASPNPSMPLVEAIVHRRTVRAYSDVPVPEDKFQWLIEMSMNAPTACNEQQWKVVCIDDGCIIKDLYERGSASFLAKAGQCFLLCYNKQSDNGEWSDHIQSGAAFITYFQLLAHSIGVGSCWIGHLPNKSELRRLFRIDRRYEPIALVSFGYYRSKVKLIPRKHGTDRVITRNTFDITGLKFRGERGIFARRILRRAYYALPSVIRRRIRDRTKPFEKKFYFEVYD